MYRVSVKKLFVVSLRGVSIALDRRRSVGRSNRKIDVEHDFQGQIVCLSRRIVFVTRNERFLKEPRVGTWKKMFKFYQPTQSHLQFACISNANAEVSYILACSAIAKNIRTMSGTITNALSLCSNSTTYCFLTLMLERAKN